MAKEWREAFCPLCGTNHGKINRTVPGKRWVVLSQENFWDRTELYNKDKPFGVIKSSEGRGTMKMVGYYDIDEDAEGYFPQIKKRLLAALGEWVEKGWITREEAMASLPEGAMVAPAPLPAKTRAKKKSAPAPALIPVKKKPAKPELSPTETVEEIKLILDEDKKAASIKKLEAALDRIDEALYNGIEDIRTAIEEYQDIERTGLTPEEYQDEKQVAWEELVDAVDALEAEEAQG